MPFPVLILPMETYVKGPVIVTRTAVMYPQVVGLPPQVIWLYEYPMHFEKKNNEWNVLYNSLRKGGCEAFSKYFK